MTPFFDDNGTEINPDLMPRPDLCLLCKKKDDSNEETLCALNIIDQKNENEFKCFAFENINDK